MHRVHVLVLLAACCTLLVPRQALSIRWDVSADGTGDAPTIQDAINLAASGDSVVLGPGTYHGPGNRDVSFLGKPLVVTSSAGSASTIVDCEGSGRGFIFNSGEPRGAILEEITITNGSAGEGGGIHVTGLSHPTIRRCVITQCNATRGGGIYAGPNTNATIEYNLIAGNAATDGGGFSDDDGSYALLRFNNIRENSAQGVGGGVYLNNSFGESDIEDNLIEENAAGFGGGIGVEGHFGSILRNRIIGNSGYGAGIYVLHGIPEGNLIARNNGTGVYLGSLAGLHECTIVENTSHGVLAHTAAREEIVRCIIAYNGEQAIACEPTSSPAPDIHCSVLFSNGTSGLCVNERTDLLFADPLFCSLTGDDAYHPRPGSPCAPAHSLCGELVGAFPVGDCASAAAALCPQDTTVPVNPAGLLVPLSAFTILNGGTLPLSFDYALTSTGPGVLVPYAGPASLAGTTPLLQPTESYSLPQAAVFSPPGQGAFTQLLRFEVYTGDEIDASCEMRVRFDQPLPVALSGLSARLQGGDVHLTWIVGGANDAGDVVLVVRRQLVDDQSGVTAIIATLPADASEYTDTAAVPGRRSEYDVATMNSGEVTAVSNAVRIHVPALSLAFQSVSPNPFRVSTRIAFAVPSEGVVTIEVFDVRGRRVSTLLSRSLSAGTHWVDWAGGSTEWTSGVFFLQLSQGDQSAKTKVTLLR